MKLNNTKTLRVGKGIKGVYAEGPKRAGELKCQALCLDGIPCCRYAAKKFGELLLCNQHAKKYLRLEAVT